MAVREPYSYPGMNSWDNPMASRGGGTGVFAQIGYGMLWAVLILATLAGTGFALYRNDVLLGLARQAGSEKSYLAWEKRVLGVPGWGTPRSVQASEPAPTEPTIDRAVAAASTAPAREPLAPPTPPSVAQPAQALAATPPAPAETGRPLSEEPSRKKHARGRSVPRSSRNVSASDSVARNDAPAPVRKSARKSVPVEDVELEEEEEVLPKKKAFKAAPRADEDDDEPTPKKSVASKSAPKPEPQPEPKTKQSAPAKAAKALPPPGDDDNPLKAAIRAAILNDQ